jgi:Glycosyl transferases group 1
LPAYYRGADVTVVPSDLLETSCMVALEAIACGCPVVVTDQVPEILGRFPRVLGVAPYDPGALRDWIADALDGRLTAPEGGAVVEHGWAAVADRYVDVYRTAGRGGPSIPGGTRPRHPAADRERLRHVRWIGGGSASGKSTVAGLVAERSGLRLYSTDEAMAGHASRLRPEDAPLLSAFLAMDMDERWVHRSPEDMLATFHWFHGEGFGLIVEDLLALAPEPVVVEGFRLLPELVEPLPADRDHAVWLLPTPEFRRAVFTGRGGSSWAFLGRTGDPERALRNLLDRDRMFTERLAADVARLGLHGVEVDGSLGEDALVERVARAFGC